MKVLFLAHGFPPHHHSGVFRSAGFARHLPAFGWEAVVLAADAPMRDVPSYGAAEGGPAGPAAEVERADWEPARAGGGAAGRALRRLPGLNFLLAARRLRPVVGRLAAAGTRLAERHGARAIYASSAPPVALLAARAVARRTGLPYVCDLRDPWTYYFGARYRHVADFLLSRRLERSVLAGAARVVANTETARRQLVEWMGLPADRVVVIPNGYDEEAAAGAAGPPPWEPGRFHVVYTGLLSDPGAGARPRGRLKRLLGLDYSPLEVDESTRSPRHVLAGVERLLADEPRRRETLRLHFIGAFPPPVRASIEAFPHPGVVRVHAPVSAAAAQAACAAADLLLLLQVRVTRRGRDACACVPGKLFGYLRSGTPVLAPMQEGDATRLLRETGAGERVPPRDAAAIAAALSARLAAWEAAGRATAHRVPGGIGAYERRALAARLAAVLDRAAGAAPPGGAA